MITVIISSEQWILELEKNSAAHDSTVIIVLHKDLNMILLY